MTRKDFELIANVIRINRNIAHCNGKHIDPNAEKILNQLADDFAAELARTNPRFDKARFIAATQ